MDAQSADLALLGRERGVRLGRLRGVERVSVVHKLHHELVTVAHDRGRGARGVRVVADVGVDLVHRHQHAVGHASARTQLGHVVLKVHAHGVDRRDVRVRDDLVAAAQRVERDAEHRDVVGLLGAVRKRVHARGDGVARLVRRQARVAVEHGQQTMLAVHVLIRVAGFGDAVGVEEQAVAGEQRHGVLAVLDAVHARQEEVRLGHAQVLVVAAGAAHERRVVAGVRKREHAGGEVEDAEPRGHEHAALIGLAQAPVGIGKGRVHVQARLNQRVNLGLGLHHEQRRGHALAGDVGDEHHESVAVEHKEVVEVAAHLARGLHARVDVEVVALGERREHARQRGVLDMARQLQLGIVAVLGLLDVALERVDGGVHVVGKLGELLVRAHVDHGVQVAGGDLVQAVAHAVQVADHALVQQAVEHRDERDVDDDLGEHHQVAGHGVVVVGLVAGQVDHDGPVVQGALHHVAGDVANLQ